MKHISDTTYKGHEIMVFQSVAEGTFAVDIRADDSDGELMAGFTDLASADHALSVGKSLVNLIT